MSDLPAKPMKRPTALSADTASKIMLAWAAGAKYKEACVAGGLTAKEAAALKEDADWMAAYENARNAFVSQSLISIKDHGREDWKATAWLLERILPERFGKRDTVDQNVKVTVLPFQSMITGEVIEAEVVKGPPAVPPQDAKEKEGG